MEMLDSKQLTNHLKQILEKEDYRFLESEIFDYHPADVADSLKRLHLDQISLVIKILTNEFSGEVILEFDEDLRDDILGRLSSKEIAEEVIEHIDTDDAADVLNDLSQERQEEIIGFLENAEHATDLIDLLNYEMDTAGGLMAKEMIRVNINWNVNKAIREMRRQAEEVDEVFTIYVVDDKNVLLGTLSLKKLLLTQSVRTPISKIFSEKDLITVLDTESSDEVAAVMEKYDLVALPVVDVNNVLLGRITIDDVVDVIKEEAEKDYQMASGISESVESTDGVWVLTRARLPWLLIGLVGGILVSRVIAMYEDQLQVNPTLAFFIPLIAAMGGNVGVQSSAIVVQGLANKTLDYNGIFGRLGKELLVALVNATICAVVLLAYVLVFNSEAALSYTVSISLFTVIIIAALFGTTIPLLLNKYKFDPALATGPFITTANDVIGLFVYFIVARFMYGL
ncbi:MAG: magnesium transporter [Sphingobacteriales bacterium]|jgi:magnesium transporter